MKQTPLAVTVSVPPDDSPARRAALKTALAETRAGFARPEP